MKIKRVLSLLLVSALALSLQACSNNNSSSEGNTDNTSTSKSEEVSKDVSNAKSSDENSGEDKTGKAVEVSDEKNNSEELNDGVYYSTLMSSLKGELSEYDTPSVYETDLNSETLTVKGSLNYHEDGKNEDNPDILANSTYTFKVNDATVYKTVGGGSPGEEYSLEDFNNFLNETKDSGLALFIYVKDGYLTEVDVSS